MFYSAKILKEELDRANLRYQYAEGDSVDTFVMTNRGRHMMQEIFAFVSKNEITVITKVAAVPAHCANTVLLEINEIHKEYRWIKAYITDDNWIEIQYDAMFTNDSVSDICINAILRVCSIAEECNNRLMRHII